MLPGDGDDTKLLMPASFMADDTTGSVRTAARRIPSTEPMAATMPNRRANAKRKLADENPIIQT